MEQLTDTDAQTGTPRKRRNFLDDIWDSKTARVLCTSLIFVVVIGFLYAARETLTLFLFAVLFAYFLEPLVERLESLMHGRSRAILVVYLVLAGVLIGLGLVVGPRIGSESRDLTTTLPSLLDRLGSGQLITEFGQHHHWQASRISQAQSFVVDHRADILDYGKRLGASLAAPAQHIWWLILIPILTVFFLKSGREIAEGAVDLGRSMDERVTIRGLLGDVNVMLGSYIRAQIILAALTLVVYTVVLSIIRVPYAFILGPISGFLEFIPVVGPAVAAVSVILIAVLAGYSHALWLVFFLGVWRLIQDYVSAPRIMGKSLEIEPLMQIFAVLAGGEIAGVVGALISVPVVASLRIVWRRVRATDDRAAAASA